MKAGAWITEFDQLKFHYFVDCSELIQNILHAIVYMYIPYHCFHNVMAYSLTKKWACVVLEKKYLTYRPNLKKPEPHIFFWPYSARVLNIAGAGIWLGEENSEFPIT